MEEAYLLALLRAQALDVLVAVHNAEQVEQLALVLMDALHLDVHQGLGVEGDASQVLNLLHSLLLGLQLHGLPLALELLVIRLLLQALSAHPGWSNHGLIRQSYAILLPAMHPMLRLGQATLYLCFQRKTQYKSAKEVAHNNAGMHVHLQFPL